MDAAFISLLQQIADNTSRHNSTWVALIAAGSAILGVTVSALVAHYAAKKAAYVQIEMLRSQAKTEREKLRVSVVTAERLRWLQDLRKQVAEFYSFIDERVMHIERSMDSSEPAISTGEMDAISRQIANRGNVILLVVNPNTPGQSELFNAINSTLNLLNQIFQNAMLHQMPPDRGQLTHLKSRAIDAMHEIGRKAWERVQALE